MIKLTFDIFSQNLQVSSVTRANASSYINIMYLYRNAILVLMISFKIYI